MLVKDLMTRNPIIVSPLEKIKNAYHILLKNKIHQVPVVEDGKLIGIVTDRDLRMALVQDLMQPNINIGTVMTSRPLTIPEDSRLVDAASIIRKKRFNSLPVLDKDGKLVGIITTTDMLDGLLNYIEISK
jgi:acetoin utilization protein AcuB